MTEFAVLLFIKRRQDSKDGAVSKVKNGEKFKEIINLENTGTEKIDFQEPSKEKILAKRKRSGNAIHHNERYNRINDLYALPFYTQTDLCAFLVFHIIYVIFNCIYWLY